MTGTAQGRNTPLHYGQVGIRCRHCAHLPKAARARGGVYYSRTIDGVCKFHYIFVSPLHDCGLLIARARKMLIFFSYSSYNHFDYEFVRVRNNSSLDQVAQNMSKLHFLKACTLIPESTKNQLKSLQSVSSRASGGKEYWAEGLRVLGIVEEGGMLRFASNSTVSSSTQISKSTD